VLVDEVLPGTLEAVEQVVGLLLVVALGIGLPEHAL